MAIRFKLVHVGLIALAMLGGCDERRSGPIVVSAIGAPPRLVNPNLVPLDGASAYLLGAVGQGLVRFDAGGQVEPALAQSWIVSDDGLRYTFRLSRATWDGRDPVTARQVVGRLLAAISQASRNPLKLQLGAIDEIEAMTGDVLEIRLKGPRPNFLQLLAQPEMAIIRNGRGTGPYQAESAGDGSIRLVGRAVENEDDDERLPEISVRGERVALAVARFADRGADLVTGGTLGTLPIARAAESPATALRFDPVAGLFGLEFAARPGPLAEASVREALSMAVDRAALLDALDVPNLQPAASFVPRGIEELSEPAMPAWVALSLADRRARARAAIDAPLVVRVAFPDEPGYRLIFAYLRRDWRAIGVEAVRAEPRQPADLRLVDEVAPITQAAWYLRRFVCDGGAVCVAEADRLLEQARTAATTAERQQFLAGADRLLSEATPFISLAAPVRWSLVSPRLTGFQPNPFGQHLPPSLLGAPR